MPPVNFSAGNFLDKGIFLFAELLVAPALFEQFRSHPIHDLFERRRLLAAVHDCRLPPIIHCDVDFTADKPDGSLEVCHAAIYITTAFAGQ